MASRDDVQAVVDRAVSDPQFGTELREKAIRAVHGGAGSQEWQDFFSHFATSPEDLQALAGAEGMAACTCHSRTTTTISTPLCTTTTTTTSN
jgi:hypothetical protein